MPSEKSTQCKKTSFPLLEILGMSHCESLDADDTNFDPFLLEDGLSIDSMELTKTRIPSQTTLDEALLLSTKQPDLESPSMVVIVGMSVLESLADHSDPADAMYDPFLGEGDSIDSMLLTQTRIPSRSNLGEIELPYSQVEVCHPKHDSEIVAAPAISSMRPHTMTNSAA